MCVTSIVLHFYISHLTTKEGWKQSEQRNVTHRSSFSFLKCSEKKEEEYDCLDILFFHFLDREHERCDRRMDTGVTYII